MTPLKTIAYLLALGLLLSGCAPAYQTNKDRLREDSTRFNENVRWQRFRAAALSVDPKQREAWVRSQERAAKVFTIADYEIKPVQVGRELAILQVDMMYHRAGDVSVQSMRRKQVWRYTDGTWLLELDREIPKEDEPPPDRLPELGEFTAETSGL